MGGSAFVIVSGLCENSTAFVSYPGDDNYNNASVTVDIIVNRKNPEMEISPDAYEVNVGQKVNVAVILPEDATGEVMIGTEVVPVVNGTAIAAVPCLTVGNLTIPVVYYGDNQFNPITGEVNITVNYVPRQNATMNVAADEVSVGENTTVVVILPEDATGNVLIGNETVTVVNGTATASIPALVAGKFTLDVVYSGDEKYNSIEDSVNITIMGPDIIIAPDVVKYFHGAERFVVNVTDYMGNPLANKTVIITINGASYTRTTNENGSASIALGLGAGVYNVTSTVDNRTVDSVVTVLTTVNGTDVVKVFKNGTQYYATFKDSQGNYLAEGTTVRFNINGVFYDRQVSGDKGLARLNINLVQGEYILTAINPVTGEQSGNLITVIPKIVENRNVTKYFRNETQYTVKLLDDEGNPVGAGKEVTFNINGVFYKRTTNESGIAKMNINLNPGTYVITAQYDGCVVSNIIKVLPKLTASDLTKTFGNPDKFVATVVDGQGMPFADQSVTFNINGVLYNKTTNATGQAALNIYLIPGEYIITSMCNDEVISNKVTVIW